MAHPDDAAAADVLGQWEQRLGPFLAWPEVSDRLGVPSDVIAGLVDRSSVVALPTRAGDIFFPAWQFELPERHRRALSRAHACLVTSGNLSPWTAASWLTSPNLELGGSTPIAYLVEGGDSASVMRAADRDAASAAQ